MNQQKQKQKEKEKNKVNVNSNNIVELQNKIKEEVKKNKRITMDTKQLLNMIY